MINDWRKTYIAVLQQSGTQNPLVVAEYGDITNVVWQRVAQGKFRATKEGVFAEDTFCMAPNFPHGVVYGETNASFVRIDQNTLELTVEDNGGNPVDGFQNMQLFAFTGGSLPALSKDWTAGKFFSQALGAFYINASEKEQAEKILRVHRFAYINQAVQACVQTLADLVWQSYLVSKLDAGTDNRIVISDLRIMRTGTQLGITLESSATRFVEPKDMSELVALDVTALQNKNKIFWAMNGSEIRLRTNLPTYGQLRLYYPRVPMPVTKNSDYLDIPDGIMPYLAMVKLRALMAPVLGIAYNPRPEIESLVSQTVRAFQGQASAEKIKEKVLALV